MTDIIVVSSTVLVYDTIRQNLTGNKTAVIHWPSEITIERRISREFDDRLCGACSSIKEPLSRCLPIQSNFEGTRNEDRNFIFAKLIQSLRTENLFVIFENNKESGSAFSSKYLDGILLKPVVYHIEKASDIHFLKLQEILTNIRKSVGHGMQLILICQHPCLKELLAQAKQYYTSVGRQKYDQQEFRWLIFAPLELRTAIIKNTSEIDNVAFVPLTSDKHQSFSNHSKLIRTLIRSAAFHMTCLENIDADTARVILANYLKIYRNYLMNASMEYTAETLVWGSGGRREFRIVGNISNRGTFKAIDTNQLYPNVAYGFNNREFIVGTIEETFVGTNLVLRGTKYLNSAASTDIQWPPFVTRKNVSGRIVYQGYCFEWLDELARTLNFSYKIVYSPDDQWGMDANGTWTGLVGLLQRREVDLVVASLTVNGDREAVMDFTYPFFYEDYAGIIAREDPDKRKWRSLIDPFSIEVLVTAVASLPVATIALFLFEKYSPRLFRIHDKNNEGLHAFYSSFWYIYGALLLQGGVHEPMSFTGRTMLTFIWIYSIILAALYSGNLMASFTVPKVDIPIKTLNELVKQSDYRWGTMNGTIYVDMLKSSKAALYADIWAGIDEFQSDDPTILDGSHEVHMNKLKTQNYVYLAEITRYEYDQKDGCSIVKFDDKIDNYPYGVGLQNGSSFLETFSERIMEISESGLPASWKREWWPKKLPCADEASAKMEAIELVDIQSAFYLIGIGIVLASLCLLLERTMFRFRKKPPDRKDSMMY